MLDFIIKVEVWAFVCFLCVRFSRWILDVHWLNDSVIGRIFSLLIPPSTSRGGLLLRTTAANDYVHEQRVPSPKSLRDQQSLSSLSFAVKRRLR